MCALGITGCGDEESDEFNPFGSTGAEGNVCEDCPEGERNFYCFYQFGGLNADDPVCAVDRESALDLCPEPQVGQLLDAEETPCLDDEADTDQGSWDPGAFIFLNSQNGHYEIDEDFFSTLVDHPGQLLWDSAWVEPKNPYYMLHGVSSNDFAARIGLQNDDKIIAVNGNLLSYDYEIYEAFVNEQSEVSFYLQVYHWPEGLRTIYIDIVP